MYERCLVKIRLLFFFFGYPVLLSSYKRVCQAKTGLGMCMPCILDVAHEFLQDSETPAVVEAPVLQGLSCAGRTIKEVKMPWCEGTIHLFACLQLQSISSV